MIKRLYDTIVGATVNVNQLVENGDFSNGTTGWTIPNTYDRTVSDGILSITVNDTSYHLSIFRTGLFVTPLHKYALFVSAEPSRTIDVLFRINDNSTLFSRIATANSWNLLSGIAIAPDARTSEFQLFIGRNQLEIGDVINLQNIMLIDLTALLGSTIADYIYNLETATAGAGVAKLREWGFFTEDYYEYNPGSLESVQATAHVMRDADDNIIGNYDLGTDTLRGLFKLDSNNNLYADGDRKTSDGVIQRKYGVRAYQSGDESLADAITDGTNTVYKLAAPTTEQSTPFTNPQICDPDGTEEYVTSNGVPVGHETRYQL